MTQTITQYGDELTGQAGFYDTYLPLVNRKLTMESVQSNNNDGQVGDLLLEFKLTINDINRVLFQTIKYLSALRIKGRPVPEHILLVSLNNGKAYEFDAYDYQKEIETVYMGSASKDNSGFIGQKPVQVLDYVTNQLDESKLITLMKDAYHRDLAFDQDWLPVHIDSTDIIGWATTYYKLNKGATKASFLGDDTIIGEIRQPNHLKGMILPYQGSDNAEFGYIMDKLNDDFQKKDLGAFFTPPLYANKAHELVYDAIRRFQSSGNSDYIILDRCAGTGNLELDLNDHVPADILDKDILSHVIVNTYEYYEYKVLMERLGDKVRYVIPPHTKFTDGTVAGSNALSKEFYENQYVQQYLQNDDCTVIMYENPPFIEPQARSRVASGGKAATWKKDYITVEAKKTLLGANSNDMAAIFNWSSLNLYLRQKTDSLVVFSPIKYWKNDSTFNQKALKGFAFNRRWFHTTDDTVVACVLFSQEKLSTPQESIDLDIYDIKFDKPNNQYELVDYQSKVTVKRIHTSMSQQWYDLRKFPDDQVGIASELSGMELTEQKKKKSMRNKPLYNQNIIGYMLAESTTPDSPRLKTSIVRTGLYSGNGFYLRSDNYVSKLPMFAAGWWSTYNPKDQWYLNGVIYRSGDGKDKYEKALQSGKIDHWLHQILFYTCLEFYTKIRSMHGSDDRWYFNELCLDNNKGKVDNPGDKSQSETLASAELTDFLKNLDADEQTLYDLWLRILDEAKQTKNYNPAYNYGVFQITKELNTKHQVSQRNGRTMYEYDYPELNGDLKSLRKLVKDYYHTHLEADLLKYEFLK